MLTDESLCKQWRQTQHPPSSARFSLRNSPTHWKRMGHSMIFISSQSNTLQKVFFPPPTYPDFAMKLLQQTLRFTGSRYELSKELPVEQVVSSHVWSKMVSLQYNLYSRLDSGARIASNGMLLLQLRTMFMAFMMSCKVEPNPGQRTNYPKPQIMGKVWISKYIIGNWADKDAKPIAREAVFKECSPLWGC